MTQDHLLALDQGTSSSRAIVFHRSGRIVAMAQRELTQIFPQPGWVEHNPMEIWGSQLAVAHEALAASGLKAAESNAWRESSFSRSFLKPLSFFEQAVNRAKIASATTSKRACFNGRPSREVIYLS